MNRCANLSKRKNHGSNQWNQRANKPMNPLTERNPDTDFSGDMVLLYPNRAEFYVSPEQIIVGAKCYRRDIPMVVCALHIPGSEMEGPRLTANQTGTIFIPLHILKRQLADKILTGYRLTLSGDHEEDDDIDCMLQGHGQIDFFSLSGNSYMEGEMDEDLSEPVYDVRVGIPPPVFVNLINNWDPFGTSVTALISRDEISFRVVNMTHTLPKEVKNLEIAGYNFPHQLTFHIHHRRAFRQMACQSLGKVWLLKSMANQRTVLSFPIDGLGDMLFTFI